MLYKDADCRVNVSNGYSNFDARRNIDDENMHVVQEFTSLGRDRFAVPYSRVVRTVFDNGALMQVVSVWLN
jgi:hypothetical protein